MLGELVSFRRRRGPPRAVMMALIRQGPQGPPGEPGHGHSLSGRSWNSLCSDAPAVPTDSEDEGGRQIDERGEGEVWDGDERSEA